MTGSTLEDDLTGFKLNLLPRVEAAIEALLALADAIDGDPDLEPEEHEDEHDGCEAEEDAGVEDYPFDGEEDCDDPSALYYG
jgi:hypothetical protein